VSGISLDCAAMVMPTHRRDPSTVPGVPVRARGQRRERRAPITIATVTEGVVIRPERDADHAVIAEVVRAAFVGQPDEVASFVERIRASEQFIPELALVAEDSSGVIAHVMLSWVGVEGGSRTRILNSHADVGSA
jgi:hypothetical protein